VCVRVCVCVCVIARARSEQAHSVLNVPSKGRRRGAGDSGAGDGNAARGEGGSGGSGGGGVHGRAVLSGDTGVVGRVVVDDDAANRTAITGDGKGGGVRDDDGCGDAGARDGGGPPRIRPASRDEIARVPSAVSFKSARVSRRRLFLSTRLKSLLKSLARAFKTVRRRYAPEIVSRSRADSRRTSANSTSRRASAGDVFDVSMVRSSVLMRAKRFPCRVLI
jgi:hypothetical protein